MSLKRAIGNYGERIAMEFLLRHGFNILGNHFSSRTGEIDIIAAKNGRLHFIEVKTRMNNGFGLPEEALTAEKIKKLVLACKKYIFDHRINTDNYQLDLIAIEVHKNEKRITLRHYQGMEL